MKIQCNECRHNEICKFQIDYKKTVDSIQVDVPTPFDLALTCPHYEVRYYSSTLTVGSFGDICATPCATSNTVAMADD